MEKLSISTDLRLFLLDLDAVLVYEYLEIGVRNNEGFRDYLEGFDEKLFELYDNPLKNEDERLKGTSFENMSEEERTRLNTIVHIIYIYQDELKAKIAQIQSLKRNIEQAEEYDLVAHLPQLQKILEDMSQKEK
jgi:hypothetical protein